MDLGNNYRLQLNRIYLPIVDIPGFNTWRDDPTVFLLTVELLVAHSAGEIIIESWGEYYDQDKEFLTSLPQVLRKRVKIIRQDESILKMADSIFLPLFNEFSVDPSGFGSPLIRLPRHLSRSELEAYLAIASSYMTTLRFLYGLKYQLQIDIDTNEFKEKLSICRQESRVPEARANIAIIEGILNCYKSDAIDTLNIIPQSGRQRLLNSFLDFLEDSSFNELSKARFALGFPYHFKEPIIRIKQLVRKITSHPEFQHLLSASSQVVSLATRLPLPEAQLLGALLTPKYLPPIVNLEPIWQEVWSVIESDSSLAEKLFS